jgi:two-component system chemotaxis response regulator CheB
MRTSAPPTSTNVRPDTMVERDLVVIGASAGGVEALRELAQRLPGDLAATVLVVLHVPATGSSALPQILARRCELPVKHAEEGDRLLPGRILIAPPDRHLLVHGDRLTLSRGPRENGYRPAVDVLFRSAARTRGSRVVGIVLSGALDDGAAGMVAIALRGGLTVVQDPQEALHPSMPRAAAAALDHVRQLPVAEIARVVVQVVGTEAPDEAPVSELMKEEAAVAELDPDALLSLDRPGQPSGWSCPDCHGSLFTIEEGGFLRFRCRVGHAWSVESLVAQQTQSLETALWMALRALEEKASLTADLSRRALARGHAISAQQFDQQYREAHESAHLLRTLVASMDAADQQPAGTS